ncbi:MAG: M20/M25/M40 family metallo-hydrolase [Betaproteobacteria bacterium]|nr:M20/M25/M40 family metallo-hydrolase [Betaproteobacteria bacterium]
MARRPEELIATLVDARHDDAVEFLRELIRVPTDTPPGDNAPHAERTAQLLEAMGYTVERHPVPAADVQACGMVSITNLIVRVAFGAGGPTIALNAHGDVVPPGEGWTRPPYAGVIESGRIYGRAAAVSKSDFATFTFALDALRELHRQGLPLHGAIELHFTYDEEFGGELGPGWLLGQRLTRPDLVIGPGFSYAIVNAHNGALHLEATLHGKAAHVAEQKSGIDALRAATVVLQALYATGDKLGRTISATPGIGSPLLNVGRIEGGINTNVVPDKVVLKIDRRMIPEEDPAMVEADLRRVIETAALQTPGIRVEIRRLLLARALTPLPGHEQLVEPLRRHGGRIFGEPLPVQGTGLYTDARLYAEAGIPVVLYGAGPRTILESNAKRADENLLLEDLRRATQVVACALCDLLHG